MKRASFCLMFIALMGAPSVSAQTRTVSPSPSAMVSPTPSALPTPSPVPMPRVDITQTTVESVSPLEKILQEQSIGNRYVNPIKYAIRSAVAAGVSANTIVLLLLLPVVAALIAGARQIVGLRGFGIFLPAALSVVFVAIGPFVGISLFLVIILAAATNRYILKALHLRLQYLPRMSLMLWSVVAAVLLVLFTAPLIGIPGFTSLSIFPVLVLVLLSEDFNRVQLGKSARTAITLTTETLILAIVCYAFLTMEALQYFALLHPEITLVSVLVFDIVIGKFIGLRFLEYWRFRKLLAS